MMGRSIEVTWYNHVLDTAGAFLASTKEDAITHAISALSQGCDVEIRDHMTGLPVPPSEKPSIAVYSTLRSLMENSISVKSDGGGNFPMGVTERTLWSAVAQGLAQITRPVGDTRIVHISDAGRKFLQEAHQ